MDKEEQLGSGLQNEKGFSVQKNLIILKQDRFLLVFTG